jgi:hypothetical protein
LSSKAGMLMMVFNEERGHKYCEELFVWSGLKLKGDSQEKVIIE